MRPVVAVVVVVVLAVLGYEYLWPEPGRSVAPAGDTAGLPATGDRTAELEAEVAIRAQQVAADAARKMQAAANRVADAERDVANANAGLQLGQTDVGEGVTKAVDEVTATLGGITDQASAEAALPKLVEIDGRLYELQSKIEQLPDATRKTFASLVTTMLPKVESAIERLRKMPGARDVVSPALEPIKAKLDDWSHGPA
jgi:hypothetical protein